MMIEEYLKILEEELRRRDYPDVEDTMSYFREMISDRREIGESEEEIAEDLGDPVETAAMLCDESTGKKREDKKKTSIDRNGFDNISEICVEVVSYDVSILPTEGEKVIIDYDADAHNNLEIDCHNGVLDISQKRNRIFLMNLGRYEKAEVRIHVPRRELENLECSSTSGNIVIKEVRAEEGDIGTVSGSIQMEYVDVRELEVSCVSGDIFLKSICSEEFETSSVSGNINAAGLDAKEIEVSSINGNISLKLAGSRQDYDIDISRIRHSESYEGSGDRELNVSTVSGAIHCEFLDDEYPDD